MTEENDFLLEEFFQGLEEMDNIETQVPVVKNKKDISKTISIKIENELESRVCDIEDALASMNRKLDTLLNTSSSYEIEGDLNKDGLPIGIILYSKHGSTKHETLEVLEYEYKLLNKGITTNSLSKAAEIAYSSRISGWDFWRVDSHTGPTIGEVYGHPRKRKTA